MVKWYYQNFTGEGEREEFLIWAVVGTGLFIMICMCCCFYLSYKVCCTGGLKASVPKNDTADFAASKNQNQVTPEPEAISEQFNTVDVEPPERNMVSSKRPPQVTFGEQFMTETPEQMEPSRM